MNHIVIEHIRRSGGVRSGREAIGPTPEVAATRVANSGSGA